MANSELTVINICGKFGEHSAHENEDKPVWDIATPFCRLCPGTLPCRDSSACAKLENKHPNSLAVSGGTPVSRQLKNLEPKVRRLVRFAYAALATGLMLYLFVHPQDPGRRNAVHFLTGLLLGSASVILLYAATSSRRAPNRN